MSWSRTVNGMARRGPASSSAEAGSRNLERRTRQPVDVPTPKKEDRQVTATQVQSFIGGAFRESRTGEVQVDPIPDPATGETIALLPYSTTGEIDEAIGAALGAFPGWADTPVPERAQVMFRFKQLLEDHFDELAQFPVGVVAGITPFNFPNMVPLWMIPLAIVCGNTFVHKPSQRTPLSAVRIAELLAEAGLPDGVFTVIHGAKDAVDTLLSHPEVDEVSFVGSATVASYIYARGAAHGKRGSRGGLAG